MACVGVPDVCHIMYTRSQWCSSWCDASFAECRSTFYTFTLSVLLYSRLAVLWIIWFR